MNAGGLQGLNITWIGDAETFFAFSQKGRIYRSSRSREKLNLSRNLLMYSDYSYSEIASYPALHPKAISGNNLKVLWA
jgi:hypothetical protein